MHKNHAYMHHTNKKKIDKKLELKKFQDRFAKYRFDWNSQQAMRLNVINCPQLKSEKAPPLS